MGVSCNRLPLRHTYKKTSFVGVNNNFVPFERNKQIIIVIAQYWFVSLLCYRLFLLELQARRSYFEEKSLPIRSLSTGNLIQLCHGFHSGKNSYKVTLEIKDIHSFLLSLLSSKTDRSC